MWNRSPYMCIPDVQSAVVTRRQNGVCNGHKAKRFHQSGVTQQLANERTLYRKGKRDNTVRFELVVAIKMNQWNKTQKL